MVQLWKSFHFSLRPCRVDCFLPAFRHAHDPERVVGICDCAAVTNQIPQQHPSLGWFSPVRLESGRVSKVGQAGGRLSPVLSASESGKCRISSRTALWRLAAWLGNTVCRRALGYVMHTRHITGGRRIRPYSRWCTPARLHSLLGRANLVDITAWLLVLLLEAVKFLCGSGAPGVPI